MCGPLASLGAPGIILPAGPSLPLNKSPGCRAPQRWSGSLGTVPRPGLSWLATRASAEESLAS